MKEFDEYVSSYDLNDYDIAYKYHHCYRVCELSDIIADKLGLDEENRYLAHVIGLLHDIGRFKQLEVYKTYNDAKSIDHADYGCEVLFKDNVIDKFNIDKKYYKIIEIAIRNHNKIKIQDGLNEQEMLQAKIIRDADKIDIFNAYTDLGAYSITTDLDEASDIVEENYFKRVQTDRRDCKTKTDTLLISLSFVYDINFREGIEIIKERNYIDKIYNQISSDKAQKYVKYFDYIKEYMKERID